MIQKRIKREPLYATKPNSDKPLKTPDVTEAEKAEIDICLNCTKETCKWGNCKTIKDYRRNTK